MEREREREQRKKREGRKEGGEKRVGLFIDASLKERRLQLTFPLKRSAWGSHGRGTAEF